MKKYILGTRGSQLSLAQTNWVISQLKKKVPSAEFEIKTIKTKGDTDARPLFSINQKGIFEKEIDRAVADCVVDFAVHSLKDVPSLLGQELVLGCVPQREPFNDVFITNQNYTLQTVPAGSTIGTSSLRRAVQISRKRNDLVVKPIRGNVETRINKVKLGDFDGIVLAQAGINRLGIKVDCVPLSVDDFPPSPGQGALGIVCRKNDKEVLHLLKQIEDNDARAQVECERALSSYVDSGCRFPVGAFAQTHGSLITLTVTAYSIDGKNALIVQKTGSKLAPAEVGRQAALELQQKGVNELAKDWRQKLEEWNKK